MENTQIEWAYNVFRVRFAPDYDTLPPVGCEYLVVSTTWDGAVILARTQFFIADPGREDGWVCRAVECLGPVLLPEGIALEMRDPEDDDLLDATLLAR